MTDLHQRRLFRVNAFTRERGAGNPAGVVLDADGLSNEQMRSIADSLQVPDTAFVLRPTGSDHDMLVRFLTPRHETSFIGHATLAAQYVLATVAGQTRKTVRQLTGMGIVEVEVLEAGGDHRIAIGQAAPALGPLFPQQYRAEVFAALGLAESSLRADCPLQLVAQKAPRLLIGVRSPEVLSSLKPDFERLKRLSPLVGAEGYFVFAVDPAGRPMATTQARLFCPAMGIPEDPVSGNTHAMLGVYLVHHGLLAPVEGVARFRGHQGAWMGRPGTIDVDIKCAGREASAVRIMGDAVIVHEGRWPGSSSGN